MRRLAAAIMMGALLAPTVARAQNAAVGGTPAAKVEFKKGEAARKTGDYKTAAQDYLRAIAVDPDYAEAHQNYIFVKQMDIDPSLRAAILSGKQTPAQQAEYEKEQKGINSKLVAQYQAWAAAHPRKAVYEWALGYLNDYQDPLAAIRYYRAAVKIDPKFAPAWQSLSLMDEVQGDLQASREDLHKAVEADPGSAAYLFYYANSYRRVDRAKYTALSMEVVKRFPTSDRAAQALYWLADAAPTDSEKIHYLMMLKNDQAPEGRGWRSSGMEMLFDIYMRSDRAQALALVREMVKADPKDPQWQSFASYAQAMVDASQLIRRGEGAEAVKALDKINLPRWYHTNQLALLRAEALDASGKTQDAYGYLLKFNAKNPTDAAQSALEKYARKLGKSSEQVNADTWSVVQKGSRPGIAFSLRSYTTGRHMTLEDFRGHVILLNFWYPLCGPCRGEFPYIQAVLDKYKAQGFEIVAVNVYPQENALVLPLLKGFKLGFLPLEGSDTWASQAYHVRGEPTSFLIGADGRVYFGPLRPVSSPEAQRTLELQVSELLRHAKS